MARQPAVPYKTQKRLETFLDLHDLTATIHAGLQVDVMRTVQFTGRLVLDIGIILERIMGASHIALGACDFGLWNSHGFGLSLTLKFPAAIYVVATGVAPTHAASDKGGYVGESLASVNPNRPAMSAGFKAGMRHVQLLHISVKKHILF